MFNLNIIAQAKSVLAGRSYEQFVIDTFQKELESNRALKDVVSELTNLFEDHHTNSVLVSGGIFRDTLLNEVTEDIDIFVTFSAPRDKAENMLVYQRFQSLVEKLQTPELGSLNVEIYGNMPDPYGFSERQIDSVKVSSNYPNHKPINIVLAYGCQGPRQALDEFTADWSRTCLPLVVDGEKLPLDNEYIITEGIHYILTGHITFSLGEMSYLPSLIKYVTKLSKKSWAKDTVFVYDHLGYKKESILGSYLNVDNLPFHVYQEESYLPAVVSEVGFFNFKRNEDAAREVVCLVDKFVFGLEDYTKFLVKESSIITNQQSHCLSTEDMIRIVEEGYIYSFDYQQFIDTSKDPYFDRIAQLSVEFVKNQMETQLWSLEPLTSNGWDFLRSMTPEQAQLWFEGKKRMAFLKPTSLVTSKSLISEAMLIEFLKVNGFGKNLPYASTKGFGANRYQNDLEPLNVKANILKGFVANYPRHLYQVILWAKTLGSHATQLSHYWLTHWSSEYATVQVPEKFRKTLVADHDAMVWVYEKGLDIDWTLSNSVRKNIIFKLIEMYNISEDIAMKLYTDRNLFLSLDFAKANPNSHIVLNEVFPTEVFYTDKYKLERLEKDDLINLNIGVYTKCCQHLTGYGKEVVKEGWIDPNSCNYVVRSLTSNQIYAHFWAWASVDGHIVIDSVEGRHNDELTEHTTKLIREFCKGRKNVLLSTTDYGFTQDVAKQLLLMKEDAKQHPSPYSWYSYMDAKMVYPITDCVPFTKYYEKNHLTYVTPESLEKYSNDDFF